MIAFVSSARGIGVLAVAAGLQLLSPDAQSARVDVVPAACPAASQIPAPAALIQPLPPTPHLGIALGSGSMHGIAHIGVIQELEARGLEVKVVAGTSIGALVGALWASGISGTQIEQMNRAADWEDTGQFALSRGGIFTNEPVRQRLEKAFRARPIESWPLRFGAVASDLDTGARVLLARGDGALAVQASTAVPAFFAPVMVEGRRLADGALVEPVPVDAARELGAAFVIAVDVAYRPREEAAVTVTQIAFQAMHILTNSLAREQMERADVAISIDLHKTFMKCGRDSLVLAGREAVRMAWPEVMRQLSRAKPR